MLNNNIVGNEYTSMNIYANIFLVILVWMEVALKLEKYTPLSQITNAWSSKMLSMSSPKKILLDT